MRHLTRTTVRTGTGAVVGPGAWSHALEVPACSSLRMSPLLREYQAGDLQSSYHRWMLSAWWDRTDPVVRDWWPVVVVAALHQLDFTAGGLAAQPTATILLGLAVAVPLRWRASHAVVVAATVSLVVTVTVVLVGGDPPFGSFVALMVVSFATAAHLPMPAALAGPALAAVPVAVLGAFEDPLPLTELVFPLVYFGGSWGAGRVVRRRHETSVRLTELVAALESQREENARLAAEAERQHIAREVHDVVAHSLGVILIQSEAAQELLDRDPPRVRRPLGLIQSTARESLEELRGVLGAMRVDQPTPMPTVARLPDLIARFREAGLSARLEVSGLDARGGLPAAVEATAYRLVQESLTNVLRHAGGASASVVVRRDDEHVRIRVHDDGPGAVGDGSGGFGLAGMRERVARHGGRLSAGPAEGGGFVVDALIPTGGADS